MLADHLFLDISVFRGFFSQAQRPLGVKGECHEVKPLSSDLPCANFGNRDSGKMNIGQSVFKQVIKSHF